MPGDGGQLEAMWLLPFAAAARGRDQSLVNLSWASYCTHLNAEDAVKGVAEVVG